MAQTQKATHVVSELRPLIEGVAKNFIDRIYGPDGLPWGTKLTELEDMVIAVRQVLSEKMLEQALARQAAAAAERPADFKDCPGCRGQVAPQDPEPRIVQTRGGEAQWQEPHEYCPKCRRSFFPSDQELGD